MSEPIEVTLFIHLISGKRGQCFLGGFQFICKILTPTCLNTHYPHALTKRSCAQGRSHVFSITDTPDLSPVVQSEL